MKRSRQILQCLKAHVQGSLPVILIKPVTKLAAAEAKGIKVVLSDDLLTVAVVRSGSGDVFELGRDETLLTAFAAAFGVLLCPEKGSLTGW